MCLSCTGSDYSVRPATNSMPVFIKDVRCTGREMSLLECGYRRNLTHSSHFEDVGVQCKKREKYRCKSSVYYDIITADCADGDIKLLGGGSNKDGALQVCFDQRWGTVSGDGWTAIDTQVACRQLEFNSTGVCKSLLFDCITCDCTNMLATWFTYYCLITLGAHGQRGLRYLVCKSVCPSVCLHFLKQQLELMCLNFFIHREALQNYSDICTLHSNIHGQRWLSWN